MRKLLAAAVIIGGILLGTSQIVQSQETPVTTLEEPISRFTPVPGATHTIPDIIVEWRTFNSIQITWNDPTVIYACVDRIDEVEGIYYHMGCVTTEPFIYDAGRAYQFFNENQKYKANFVFNNYVARDSNWEYPINQRPHWTEILPIVIN